MLGKSCRRAALAQSFRLRSVVILARMRCQQGEVMTMSKPTTELGQRCPPPPYTRWDQRGKPVLLSYLKLIDGKQLCLSLETDDPDIAKRHMRLLVAMSVARGRLSPDARAAEVYGLTETGRSWIEKVDTEIRRLKALPEVEFGPEALATAKRWGHPHDTPPYPFMPSPTFAHSSL
jgi:hypothetical protein